MTPAISFVLAADRWETVRDVVRALAGQTVSDRIELVLSGPAELRANPAECAPLAGVRVVEAGSLVPLTEAQAAGVRAASAPLVMIGETHAFPEPDCVERVLEAFGSGPYGAVAPRIRNANPATARSWGNLFVTYGQWLTGPARELEEIASHNAAFRRERLLELGDALGSLLDNGGGVGAALRGRGHALLFEPRAVLAHLNVVRPSGWIADRFYAGWVFGAARSRPWSQARRLAYALGAPLIPVVFLARVRRGDSWRALRREVPRGTLAATLLSTLPIAAGEACGYAVGMGPAPGRLIEYELHRARHA